MRKSKSLTFKENKREHELYTWTHTIQKKKKKKERKKKRLSLGLQMYDLDIHCSGSIKKDYFHLCWWRRQPDASDDSLKSVFIHSAAKEPETHH